MENKTNNQVAKPLKVRGTATIDIKTGDVDFRAYQQGDPVQKNVRKQGGSSFYETEGRKESSYICHLKVPKDSADPAAEMQEQLEKFLKPLVKKEPTRPRGKRLLETQDVTVYHNRRENKVSVLMTIDLTAEGELSAKLFNLTSEVNKCFAINKTSLRPQSK